jgi:hypothetical protein
VTQAFHGALLESARSQRAVGDVCADCGATYGAILEELKANRLGDANEHTAMVIGIIDPLKLLAGRCGKVVVELDRIAADATQADADAPALAERAGEQADEQGAILEAMRDVARRMEKLRSLQVMTDKIQRMIRWVQELYDEIEKQRQAGYEELFGPTTRPSGGG